MDTAVLMEIESLRRASMADLRKKYREVFQEETRCRHREHLFRRIAWRLQALAEGDLSERARGRANEIAQDGDIRVIASRSFQTPLSVWSCVEIGGFTGAPTLAAGDLLPATAQ
jgi:Protein of unknown function (DUF2924)